MYQANMHVRTYSGVHAQPRTYMLSYKPRFKLLGLEYITGNHTTHLFQPLLVLVSNFPSAMARIKPDGNCFFRSIALAVTGSQEYNHEIRLLITTHMIQNYSHPKLSCLLPPNEPMECYVKRSGMQVLETWATELEMIALNSLFAPNVYIRVRTMWKR